MPLTVADARAIGEFALTRLGAHGVLRPSRTNVQVVIGPVGDLVAEEMRDTLDRPQPVTALSAQPAPATPLPPVLVAVLGTAAIYLA